MLTFAERLKALLKQKGLSSRTLSRQAHISPRTLSRWEAGESKPSTEHLLRLADALNMAPDELEHGELPSKVRDAIEEGRSLVAEAAGVSPDKVVITIRRNRR